MNDNKIFWEFCQEKKLVFQKCKNCGKIRWPYSIACPECYSFDYEYYESKGIGKIYTYAIFHMAFDKKFKDKVPYVIAVIELENGVKFLSNIINTTFEKIECNKDVKLVWDNNIPKFEVI